MQQGWKVFSFVACAAGLSLGSQAWGKECGGTVVCECGDIVIADYKLPADLGPCPSNGNGLDISGNVTLNGRGHRIVADAGNTGVGVTFRGHGAQVKNIRISNFTRCVRFRPLTTPPNPPDVRDNVVKNSELHDCSLYGVDFASGAVENTVKGNWIHDNGSEGVHLGGGSQGNRVIGNIIHDNVTAQVGLVSTTTQDSVTANVLLGGQYSVRLTGGANGNLFKANIADNQLLVSDSSDNEFRANTFRSVQFTTTLVPVDPTKTSNNLVKSNLLLGGDPCIQFHNATDNILQEVKLWDCVNGVLATGMGTNTLVAVKPLDPAQIEVQDQAVVIVCNKGPNKCQEFTAP